MPGWSPAAACIAGLAGRISAAGVRAAGKTKRQPGAACAPAAKPINLHPAPIARIFKIQTTAANSTTGYQKYSDSFSVPIVRPVFSGFGNWDSKATPPIWRKTSGKRSRDEKWMKLSRLFPPCMDEIEKHSQQKQKRAHDRQAGEHGQRHEPAQGKDIPGPVPDRGPVKNNNQRRQA
jgi:hypothetical protein